MKESSCTSQELFWPSGEHCNTICLLPAQTSTYRVLASGLHVGLRVSGVALAEFALGDCEVHEFGSFMCLLPWEFEGGFGEPSGSIASLTGSGFDV